MNVTGVKVEVLQVPVEHPYTAAGRQVEGNWHVLARVMTDDGIEGIGYVVSNRGDLVRAVAQATRELGEHLIGAHVLEVEAAWARLVRAGGWTGPGACCISPSLHSTSPSGMPPAKPQVNLSTGSWAASATVCRPMPAIVLWYSLSLDELAESASQHVLNGYRTVKLRLGKEARPEGEVERVRAVRQAVGTEVQILVDATESWDRAQATRTGRLLQEAGITWLEDPLHHQDVHGLALLAETLEIPVAGGEHLYDLHAFQELLQHRAVDIAIIDLARAGGITPWRRIAAVAQAHHVPVCGHVIPEIHVHLLSAIPHAFMVENVPRSAAILQAMPVLEDGCLVAPNTPGLGVKLDEAAVARYRVD